MEQSVSGADRKHDALPRIIIVRSTPYALRGSFEGAYYSAAEGSCQDLKRVKNRKRLWSTERQHRPDSGTMMSPR